MTKLIVIGSIIVIFIGGYFIYQATSEKELAYAIEKAERGEIKQTVSVTGTVVPAKQIDLEFEKSGKLQNLYVQVSQQVEAGQKLAALGASDLYAQLEARKAALAMAEAKLAKILAGTRPEEIQVYQAAVENAQVAVANKEQALLDAQKDAESDLAGEYQEAPDILNEAYLYADNALNKQIDELFESDNTNSPDLVFATNDSTLASQAESARVEAGRSLVKIYDRIISLDPSDYDSLDATMAEVKESLNQINNGLAIISQALNSAITTTNFTESDLSAAKTNLSAARTNLNSEISSITSQQQTISSTKLTNQTNINVAQANLDSAKSALAKAEQELVLKEAGAQSEDIQLARAEVSQARANLQQTQAELSKAVLTAPVDGVVTKIEKELGETVAVKEKIISMISDTKFQVEANISETEIAKVKINDQIEMTLDALGPEEKFSGRVIEIDPAETVISGVIYYQITSVFDLEDERIKSGMTVNMDILTEKKQDALYLPYYVIKQQNGGKYVLVEQNGEVVKKEIKTGLEGEARVEIIEGLKQGDQVLIEK